ncbi:uncharacterized protein BXZ73DRAFT_101923 [Epithele typhae]|uniref:uncharacterized protein n=1 Tax=Epithele typhae TaxID=378194 RepID=UPI0020077656|nr:uncharacterized protein BXZ73DRAFT_101923 [Epithele typhae]KAH9929855.1 hypothetical protein BXZ73DRAFT_101923 [Epithele typhae]
MSTPSGTLNRRRDLCAQATPRELPMHEHQCGKSDVVPGEFVLHSCEPNAAFNMAFTATTFA